MNNTHRISAALILTAACVMTPFRQLIGQTASAPLAATAETAVPSLIPFSGTMTNRNGQPISDETTTTFLVFKDQTGGEPLFVETQDITPDKNGEYKIQLGASLPNGLPENLFASGEARWLEVQPVGLGPQPRVLIASVPYALKAADAATLGGLPASAFILAGTKTGVDLASAAVTNASTAASNTVTTTGGIVGQVPVFDSGSSVTDSNIYTTSFGIGINHGPGTGIAFDVLGKMVVRGIFDMGRTADATISAPTSSNPIQFHSQVYSTALSTFLNPFFELRSEPAGNNSASPSATFNLLYSNGTENEVETGLSINGDGVIHFAPGQTFPGSGSGTITGITAGTGLTGGGTTGNVTLNLDTTKVVTSVAAGTGLMGGGSGGNLTLSVNPEQVPLLNVSDTFAQNVTVGGQLIAGNGNTAGGIVVPASQANLGPTTGAGAAQSYPLDMQAVATNNDLQNVMQDFRLLVEPAVLSSNGASSSLNLQYGINGASPAETGISFGPNGAINGTALTLTEPAGIQATPTLVVQADENGAARNAASQVVVEGSTFPGDELLMGFVTDPVSGFQAGYATIQATITGAFNTALMLQPNGGCVCIATGNQWLTKNPLIVGQGQGTAIADGWSTYSSRRFKTDIKTLPDALDKVEKLRGVSYTLKATGKHEIGVIAEEVGKVVPEVVTYEANGKDAQSVDYTRLTALLIEATKQQQVEIAKQQSQIADALREVKAVRTQMRRQDANIVSLKAQLRTARTTQAVNTGLVSAAPSAGRAVIAAAR